MLLKLSRHFHIATLLFLACNVPCASAQNDTSRYNGLPITRQHFVVKYNVGLIGVFLGAEGLASYAPCNWLHVQTSYRIYEAALSGLLQGSHRAGWDVYMDVRYHVPFNQTFTGFSFGPFYNYGGGTLAYKERLGQYYVAYFDRFDFKRHVVGGTMSFGYCVGERRRLLLELYLGAGYTFASQLTRRSPEHLFMSDHTHQASGTITGAVRAGFCVGYVFF